MTNIFLPLLKMSGVGSIVILAVILVRFILRRAPKIYSYLLWSVAAFRLLFPVSFTSKISAFNCINEDSTVNTEALTTVTAEAGRSPVDILSAVWVVGMVILIIYSIFTYYRLKVRLKDAVHLYDNIYTVNELPSPFVMGFLSPVIYIPMGLNPEEREYVLKHERVHIKRCDHIVKLFAFGVLTLHWFNPFCWLAFVLMSRDMEMSCDERVLRDGNSVRIYGNVLVSMATATHFPSPGPISFGEVGVKRRVKNILSWKKPAVWISVISVMLCICTVSIFATDPEKDIPEPPNAENTVTEASPDTVPKQTTDTTPADTTAADTTTVDTTTVDATTVDTTTADTTTADTTPPDTTTEYIYTPPETYELETFSEEENARIESQFKEHQEWVNESIKADVSEWLREHPEVDPTKNRFIKNGWD